MSTSRVETLSDDPNLKQPTGPRLSWARQDIEQRLGFPGGRFTRVNTLLTAVIGLALTISFYTALLPISSSTLAQSFTGSMHVPKLTVFFSFWALAILFIKWRKLAFQRRALSQTIISPNTDFVLAVATVDDVTDRIHELVDDPRNFVLFNRIVVALSNLRNLGRVTDVDDILRSQAENDESSTETTYSLVSGFVWAIPVLGFIGTVLGLSAAIGGFSSVLQSADDLSTIKTSLQGVTAGLATAFQTTLQALVAALIIQLILTYLKASEEEFLDACSDYCLRNVVNRLRIMPYEQPDE